MSQSTLLALISLLITVGSYYIAKALYKRHKTWWLLPSILAPIVVVFIVVWLSIPLPTYFEYTHWLVTLLAPATVAFAVPIYRERQLIRQYPLTISCGVIAGVMFGLTSTWLLTKVIPLPEELIHSVLVRSVSTPFALEATSAFGGVPELTALMVMLTGIIGMVIGEPLMKLFRIHTSLGRGVALGASAHGSGTAIATEIGQQEGVVASLTMIFAGIVMVICAPFFAWLFS